MNTESDEVEEGIGEVGRAGSHNEPRRLERKAVQAPGRSAGKVKQMVDWFEDDDAWNDLTDA
jgi:hypothetical protein